MSKLLNLARMSTATTGTGTITLGTAIAGFLTFAQAGALDGDTIAYAISDGSSGEIGYGVYTASGTLLTRNVINSTNSNAAISLSGTAQVFSSPASSDLPYASDVRRLFLSMSEAIGDSLGMVDGISDSFGDLTDVDTATAGSDLDTSVTGSLRLQTFSGDVVPTMAALTNGDVTISASTTLDGVHLAWKAFDDVWTTGLSDAWHSAAEGTAAWIQADLGSGNSKILGAYKVTAYNDPIYTSTGFTLSGSNDSGTTWTVIDTQTGLSWTATETKEFTLSPVPSAYEIYRLDVTAAGESSYNIITQIELISNPSVSVTIPSNSFSANAEPDTIRIGAQMNVPGTATLNTDIILEVSRDDGTTWTAASMTALDFMGDGTTYYEDANVDVSGQPSGTDIKWRAKILNSEYTIIYGILLQWS